jgi:hypothetical protein
MKKLHKNLSKEQIEKIAEDFIQNNNCTVNKTSRKRIAKLVFLSSRNHSSNL